MKLIIGRKQTVSLNFLREPSPNELVELSRGNFFDVDDLLDWDSEEIEDEDYSFNVNTIIPKPKIEK